MVAILGPIVKVPSALFGSGRKRYGKKRRNRYGKTRYAKTRKITSEGLFMRDIKEENVQTYQQT